MNLAIYQQYKRHIVAFAEGIKMFGYEDIMLKRSGVSVSQLKEENPEEYETQKQRFLMNVTDAHNIMTNDKTDIYEIDDKIKKICAFSNVPKNVEKYAFLPNDYVFIDVDFTEEEYNIKDKRIFGIALRNGVLLDRQKADMIKKLEKETDIVKYAEDDDLLRAGKCINALVFAESQDGKIFLDSLTFAYNLNKEYEKLGIKTERRIPTRPFIKKFVLNFLNFLNDEEVVLVHRKRGKKNQERRKKEGKMPLPDSRVVKITGILKKYIGDYSTKAGWHYSFRFPVRSHRRRLYDEFGNLKKVIKIKKFYKGKGVTIEGEKHYKVVADKKHSRVKEWNKEHIDMDDIKPLDKPLREKRNEKR